MWLYHRVRSQNDADGMANSVDPDQTAPSLIWVCTVCPDLSVQKLRKITVPYFSLNQKVAVCMYLNGCKEILCSLEVREKDSFKVILVWRYLF